MNYAARILSFGILACLLTSVALAPPAFGQPSFCRAVLARQKVTLSGTMLIDSFNSLDPNHSTNGQYDPAKRQDGGDVASVSDTVTVITDTGNTSVYGHLLTGPSGSVSISGNASVGSLAWVNGGNRGIQPGWYSNNFSAVIPDVSLPGLTFTTLKKTPGQVNGTNYNYVLTTGNYVSANFSLSGSMCINGDVVLYFPSGLSITGQGFIYIAPGAKLTIYLGAPASLSGGGIVNGTGLAANCACFGLPSCSGFQYSGSSSFVGFLYAPEAAVTLSGGGSQILNFVGSLVANTARISGSCEFHFDQALCGCQTPVVTTPPADQTVCPGDTAFFYVTASGTRPTYQWYQDTTLLSGQTGTSLEVPHVGPDQVGIYSVVVSGACGTPITNSALLATNQPVLITAGPTNQTTTNQFSYSATIATGPLKT